MAMRMFAAITAALIVLAPANVHGRAPDYAWRVLSAGPGFSTVMLVSDPIRGPSNRRVVATLIVAIWGAGGDRPNRQTSWWRVDCGAETIVLTSSMLAGGTATAPRRTPLTPIRHVPWTGNPLHKTIAAYACTGKRESSDPSRFWGDREAIAYATALAKKNAALPFK
jgi:hypothetical protein